jgi:intergrase/recombinase
MKEQIQTQKKQQEWKSVTVRLKENELAVLNSKLKINGFENFSQFIHAWIKGDYPAHENNEQVERLITRIRDKGIVDPLTAEFNPTFYRNVKSEDMLKDLSKRYVYAKHAKDLVRYFERYAEIFFTKPQLIRDESGHKRAWICDAMRRFGEYYDRKFHNPELKLLIQEIIERYELNKKLKMCDRVWISDEGYIKRMISIALKIDGDLGLLIKLALFSGLRGEEIIFVHDTSICENQSGCNCQKLHVIEKSDGYSVVVLNRSVGQKHSYFTIVPTYVWNDFRTLEKVNYAQRQTAHLLIKNYTDEKVSFMDLRKFHYNVLCRSDLREQGADVLAGRAKSVSAKHYLIYELDKMVKQYSEAWKNYL